MFFEPNGVDFEDYRNTANSIFNGYDPYNLDEFKNYFPDKEFPPLNPPTMSPFFIPLMLFPKDVQFLIYSLINIGIAIFTIYFVTRLFKIKRFFPIASLLFLNVIPTRTLFVHGQIGIIVTCCLILAIYSSHFFFRSIMLGLAMALKISIVVPFFFLYFLLRMTKESIIASFFFLISLVFPLLFDIDLIKLYENYIANIQFARSIDGWTSYISKTILLTEISFFKLNLINYLLKGSIFIVAVLAIIKSKKMSPALFVFLGCSSLAIAYHRVYDLVVIIPFLILWVFEERYIALAAILFMMLPYTWVLAFTSKIGGLIGENSWIYLTNYDISGYVTLFPIESCFNFLLLLYAGYYTFSENQSIKMQKNTLV